MDNMYEIIKSLCDEQGLSIAAMCREAGIGKSVMSELKAGRSKSLSVDNAAKVAGALNVSVEYLSGVTDQKEKPAEKSLDELIKDEPMAAYDNLKEHLTEADKEDIAQLIRIRAELNRHKKG